LVIAAAGGFGGVPVGVEAPAEFVAPAAGQDGLADFGAPGDVRPPDFLGRFEPGVAASEAVRAGVVRSEMLMLFAPGFSGGKLILCCVR
jgi:hypothetical protein